MVKWISCTVYSLAQEMPKYETQNKFFLRRQPDQVENRATSMFASLNNPWKKLVGQNKMSKKEHRTRAHGTSIHQEDCRYQLKYPT